ncbi:Topoisomerase 1-associated factor 1 at N-terminal half [Coccomyxa sp. Obi]|nr:Topoisomerase 1-associated factor 1 at N-terminal half [Coccomyxa sp. Obi]
MMESNLLISVIGGLGRWESLENGQQVYSKDDDCLDCLKDLQRFLRQDDQRTRDCFFTVGRYKTARNDLVPIITTYAGDTDLVYNALKVVTFLTMPVDPDSDNHGLQVEIMHDVKDAFLAQDALAVVVALVTQPLMRHADGHMSDKDVLIVQLVVTFLRNLIVIPDSSFTSGSSGSHRSRMSSKLLSRLHEDSVLELLLVMAQHTSRGALQADAPLLLEIFVALFEHVDAEELQSRQLSAAALPKTAPRDIRQTVNTPHHRPRIAVPSTGVLRHPRFGGVFTKKADGGGAQYSIGRGPTGQDPLGPVAPVMKGPKAEGQHVQRLDDDALPILKAFAEQFLSGSYNLLMSGLRRDLEPGLNISRLSEDDFLRFFKLAGFFTRFVRQQQEEVQKEQRKNRGSAQVNATDTSPFASISATMGWEMFHLVQSVWHAIIDLPAAAPASKWDLQHASLALLKEMLFTLDLAQRTGHDADKKAADRLQRRLLHDDLKESGLLPVLARLVKQFVFKFQSKEHAKDLIQALHLVLRMLERLSQEEAGGFLVRRRAAPGRQRKATKQSVGEDPDSSDDEGKAAADGADDVQPSGAAAVEDPAAPATPPSPQSPAAAVAGTAEEGVSSVVKMTHDKDPLEELLEEEEEGRVEREHRLKEVACNLQQRVRQELAFPAIMHFYTWLLQGYATNSRFVNHCIVAFLQRITDANGLNLEPMLYQVSVLRVFHQLLSDASFRKQPGATEVCSFAARIVRNIMSKLVPRPAEEDAQAACEGADAKLRSDSEKALQKGLAAMMFVELLFWKNTHDSEEIRNEYKWKDQATLGKERRQDGADAQCSDASDLDAGQFGPAADAVASQGRRRKRGRSAAAFSEEETALLVQLFEKHGTSKGYMDLICSDMNDKFKRSQIQRQLKVLGLKKGQLTDNQKSELQRLFHAHKGKRDCLATIAAEFPGQLSKGQIRSQLRRLGLQLKQPGEKEQGVPRSDSDDSSERGGNLFSDSSTSQSNSEACSNQAGRKSRRTRDEEVSAPSDNDNSNKENTRLQHVDVMQNESESDEGAMSMPTAPIYLPKNPIVRKRKLTRIMKRAVVVAAVNGSFADLEDE